MATANTVGTKHEAGEWLVYVESGPVSVVDTKGHWADPGGPSEATFSFFDKSGDESSDESMLMSISAVQYVIYYSFRP